MLEIVRASQDLPFTFHVYGRAVLDKDIYTKDFKKQKNIKYCGGFNMIHSLPIDGFDVLLYTSQWDGLPTILFDAMSLQLPTTRMP